MNINALFIQIPSYASNTHFRHHKHTYLAFHLYSPTTHSRPISHLLRGHASPISHPIRHPRLHPLLWPYIGLWTIFLLLFRISIPFFTRSHIMNPTCCCVPPSVPPSPFLVPYSCMYYQPRVRTSCRHRTLMFPRTVPTHNNKKIPQSAYNPYPCILARYMGVFCSLSRECLRK